jgi:hypothetical protein
MCCVSQPTGDGKAVCVPGNYSLYSATSELPANPFFAMCDLAACAALAPSQLTLTVGDDDDDEAGFILSLEENTIAYWPRL